MKNVRKVVKASLFIVILATGVSCTKEQVTTGKVKESIKTTSDPIFTITCTIGRKIYNCERGFGICDCTFSWGGGGVLRTADAGFDYENGVLVMTTSRDLPEDCTGNLIIDEPFALNSEISSSLGYSEVVILPGEYTAEDNGESYKFKLLSSQN